MSEAPPTNPIDPRSLPIDIRAAIESGWRRGVAALGRMSVPLEAFEADVVMLWHRGCVRLALAVDVGVLREDTGRLLYEDLYLARSCEHGDEAAWTRFVGMYRPRLEQLLSRHTRGQEAESVAAGVIADAALPPPRTPDRTFLGSYEGTGPLWAWLATIAIRRLRRTWRAREAPLEGAGEPAAHDEAPADAEAQRFLHALHDAWQVLEPREALAVRWKHGHGHSQREIARYLKTSEPTVSRIVTRAIEKLRGRLVPALPEVDPVDAATWTRIESALAAYFASFPDEPHPRMRTP